MAGACCACTTAATIASLSRIEELLPPPHRLAIRAEGSSSESCCAVNSSGAETPSNVVDAKANDESREAIHFALPLSRRKAPLTTN